MARRKAKKGVAKPKLGARTSLADFREHYWLKDELTAFAREQGLPVHGDKRR